MADNEGEEVNVRGNEWEVVSLTASTYAAAPGPIEVKLKDEEDGDPHVQDAAETSQALFMSRHFDFPAQHENLPLEPADTGILEKHTGKDDVAEVLGEEGRSCEKDDSDWAFKGLAVPDEFPGMHFIDEKDAGLPTHGPQFEEGSNLQGLDLMEKEQCLYTTATFSSFRNETAHDIPSNYVENVMTPEDVEASEHASDLSADLSELSNRIKDEFDSDLPCGAWWKRRAASFYSQAKEANTFWSVFVAAAVVGIVILGQRWQQEKWQVVQLRWHLTINDE